MKLDLLAKCLVVIENTFTTKRGERQLMIAKLRDKRKAHFTEIGLDKLPLDLVLGQSRPEFRLVLLLS